MIPSCPRASKDRLGLEEGQGEKWGEGKEKGRRRLKKPHLIISSASSLYEARFFIPRDAG